jgi:hypothetical protein
VLGTPFSVENLICDLLRFPPWAGDPDTIGAKD